ALEEKYRFDERLRVDQHIKESEEKFRSLAETIPAAIFLEVGGKCSYVNCAAEDVTGYSREDLSAMTFLQLLHPESKESFVQLASKAPSGNQANYHYEVKIRRKDKEVRWLDVTVKRVPMMGQMAMLTTAFDVSGRKSENDSRNLRDSVTGLPNNQFLIE